MQEAGQLPKLEENNLILKNSSGGRGVGRGQWERREQRGETGEGGKQRKS